jgi:peptidyl-prolyl cis-trans isomerase B (cyclophilin B)
MKKSIIKLIAVLLLLVSVVLPVTSCKKDIYYVRMEIKNMGYIILELDRVSAPKTVDNFVSLVKSGFYDGLTFHRVIEGFMIQGGDPEATGYGGSDKEIFGEFLANGYGNPISHKRGVISMARSNDYNSASSQFFIVNDDAAARSLDGLYAAFGYVIEGMQVVDKITGTTGPLATDGNGGGIPYEKQAVIVKAEVLKNYKK